MQVLYRVREDPLGTPPLSLPRKSSENLEKVPRIWEGEGYWRSEIFVGLSRETSTQENLTPAASGRPETGQNYSQESPLSDFFPIFSSRVELSKV